LLVDKKGKPRGATKDSEPQSAISDRRPSDSTLLSTVSNSVSNGAKKFSKTQIFPVRRDSLSTKKHGQSRQAKPCLDALSITEERPRAATFDSYESGSDSPPRSSSTDRHPLSASTAITSVAMTPLTKHVNQSPHQGSLDFKAHQSAIARADSKAIEWINMQRQKATEESAVPIKTPSRTGTNESNSGGFAAGLRNFIRGRSRSRSRSQEPTRKARAGSTAEPAPQTWKRGLSLRRQKSTSSLSEVKGPAPLLRTYKSIGDLKAPVDLNRQLPPLPSLDTYREPETTDPNIHVATLVRPKSGSLTSHPVISAKAVTVDTVSIKALSLKQKDSGSKTNLVHPLTIEPIRKMSIQSSVDSCFTPIDSYTPSRSVDVTKFAAKARSTENLRQNYHRKNSLLQSQTPRTAKSAATSRPTSRPVSRGSSKHPPAPVKYSIIPHQRTPSQPIFSNRGAISSVTQLPPRPATRDASTPHYGSSRPSVSSPSVSRAPVNFSRKFPLDPDDQAPSGTTKKEDQSQPATAESNVIPAPALDITALPPMPSKRPSGLRRVLSSLNVRRGGKSMREKDLWLEQERWHQTPPMGSMLTT
jgi:hypothetical protein